MRAPLSIVIPTLNAEAGLMRCLPALIEGLHAGLIREVIFSDGGSTDRTVELAQEVGAIVISGPASRGGQLRRGAEAAKGGWLMFLHADTVLSPGWSLAVEDHLATGLAGYAKLQFAEAGFAGRWVAAWANVRSRVFQLPYGDQGLLVPHQMYLDAGGYPDIPLMEDVALVRKLRGYLTKLDCIATTSAERYQKNGWLRRGSRNLWTLIRYFAGVSPEKLAQAYRR